MGAERYRAEGFCVEENNTFRWFQGYEDVTPTFCISALERMASVAPEVMRDKINNYPLGEQLLSRLYFSGFPDDVMGELFPDEAPEEELVFEEIETKPLEEVIELNQPPIVFRTTVLPTIMPVDRPKPERAASPQQKPITLGATQELDQQDDWQEAALCAQTDPEVFFPEKGGSTKEAKKVCKKCDVRAQCLESAIENDERFGVWGGLSQNERRKLRRGQVA